MEATACKRAFLSSWLFRPCFCFIGKHCSLIQKTVCTDLGKLVSFDNGLWIQWIIAGILSCSNLQGEMYKQLGQQGGAALCGRSLWRRILGAGKDRNNNMNLFCFSLVSVQTCFYLAVCRVDKLNCWVCLDGKSQGIISQTVQGLCNDTESL